ncbi:motile sperm domain-containing protein 2-like [Sinocyclocheilus grahami]|uniref:motile sperm domain-containing protein 2-like n=1 Tax=Sinocyclocheilus grahami TaxID=75366 RepID=UPI0007AD2E45|nr:PREDICTED: motile sperm domain-containing protein 2-like [Sinocyclocheilus grahami]
MAEAESEQVIESKIEEARLGLKASVLKSQHGVTVCPVSQSLRSIPLKTRPLLTDSSSHHGGGGIRAGHREQDRRSTTRFKSECVEASQDRYDSRDVEKLFRDDALVEGYLTWRHFVVEDTLKMIDESLQWRKEFNLNGLTESSIPRWMFESGAVNLHGYDKDGNKLK